MPTSSSSTTHFPESDGVTQCLQLTHGTHCVTEEAWALETKYRILGNTGALPAQENHLPKALLHRSIFTKSAQTQGSSTMLMSCADSSTIDVLDLSPLLLPQPAGPGCPIHCSQDYFDNFLIGSLNSNRISFISTSHIVWEFVLGIQIWVIFFLPDVISYALFSSNIIKSVWYWGSLHVLSVKIYASL